MVLPRATEVKGTGVGETRPRVCEVVLSSGSLALGFLNTYSERRKDSRDSWSIRCAVGYPLTFRCTVVVLFKLTT